MCAITYSNHDASLLGPSDTVSRCEEEWLSGKLANLSAADVEQTVDDNFKEGMDGPEWTVIFWIWMIH